MVERLGYQFPLRAKKMTVAIVVVAVVGEGVIVTEMIGVGHPQEGVVHIQDLDQDHQGDKSRSW